MEELLYQVKTLAGSCQRVLFGSDYPIYYQKETVQALGSAVAV